MLVYFLGCTYSTHTVLSILRLLHFLKRVIHCKRMPFLPWTKPLYNAEDIQYVEETIKSNEKIQGSFRRYRGNRLVLLARSWWEWVTSLSCESFATKRAVSRIEKGPAIAISLPAFGHTWLFPLYAWRRDTHVIS